MLPDGFYMSYTESEFIDDPKAMDERKITNFKHLWKSGYKTVYIDSLRKLSLLIKSDWRCYSAGMFEDGEATNASWREQHCIILDVDDGLSLEDAKRLFMPYMHIIATTRSHQKEKNGKVCDRFRVILPLAKPITLDAEAYKESMEFLITSKFPFADKACKDPSRIYFGNSDAQIFTNVGEFFDFETVVEKLQKAKEVERWAQQRQRVQQPRRTYMLNDGTKADWYREHWLTDRMREKLKVDEKMHEGNRNNALYAWAVYLKNDIGLSDEEVREAILWINNGSLSEKEIEQTIFRSLRIDPVAA